MFGKLLKHEWLGSRRLVGILCGIIAAAGVLSGGSLRNLTWSAVNENQAMVAAYTTVLATALMVVLGCCVLSMYFLVYRFYKTRFTDQGYLMLTLPVTTHQQLLASITNTVIGMALVALTACASMSLAIVAFTSIFEEPIGAAIWQIAAESFAGAAVELGIIQGAELMLIPLALIMFLEDIVLFMLALTVGAQASKLPLPKGAAVYILTDVVVSEGCSLLGRLLENQTLSMAVSCVVYGVVGVAAYFLMYHILDKKLNLT